MAGRAAKSLARTAPPALREFDLEGHIFYLFTQIFGRRNRLLAEALRPLGITVPQWRILAVLRSRADCTMNQLADLTTVDRTTLTRALDRMARDRLIERRVDPDDRRSVRLRLTAAGSEAFRQVLPRVIDENERAMDGFSAGDRAALLETLHRMVRNLDPEYDLRNARRTFSSANTRRNKGEPA